MDQKLVFVFAVIGTCIASAIPIDFENSDVSEEEMTEKEPRQLNIQQRPDGTIVGSISVANAVDAPGFDNAFAMSQAFEIGPKGSSSSFASAFDSDIAGNRMSFANSNAQSNDMFGGFSNANANSFSNPLFSNAQANAFNSNPFMQFGK